MELTDNRVMLAVKAGAIEQFSVLFERHHKALFAFFYRMTGQQAVSEDLAQEVFLRMLRYRNTFLPSSQFRSWMYQVARNVRADHFKSHLRDRFIPIDELAEPGHSFTPGHAIEREQQAALLERALRKMSDDKRELLVLARYQELPYEEIAVVLEIDVGAVKTRVHRAMKELRELFLTLSGEKQNAL